MKRSFVPLLPATNPSVTENGPQSSTVQRQRPKRITIAIACERCRKSKVKCDGARPSCGRCNSIPVECYYDVKEGVVSRRAALKEAAHKSNHENLQLSRDVAAWEELFENLQLRPEEEAFELLRRLRASNNPLEVLDFIRHGDLLLNCGISAAPTERESKIDSKALELAPIKVPARPWTAVAQDGIVSELVSAWFKWDDSFGYPFIDRELFINEMRSGNTERARYCSPFLVNAICAFRCFTSESMRQVSHILKTDLRAKFYAEAKKLFDLDQSASVTNVQGLWILFMFSCGAGTDRAGSMYRFAAYQMLKQMRLRIRYSKLRDDVAEQALEKRAIAKLYWGIFSFESLASQAFLQPSMMETPWMDSPYPPSPAGATKDDNLDMFGEPYTASALGPPMIEGARHATFQLCKLMNEVMGYITEEISEPGGAADVQRRSEYYTLLTDFGKSLPLSLQRVLYDTVGFNILRNLDLDSSFAGSTVSKHIIRHCELDTSIMEHAMAAGFFTEWSIVVVCGVLNVLPNLVPLLQDPEAQSIFVRSCIITRILSRQLPILRVLIRGVQAMAASLRQSLPTKVQSVFQGLAEDEELAGDVPTAYQLPRPEEMRKALLDDGVDATNVGVDLSLVIAKWSAMSISSTFTNETRAH
ncbi:MAG: hypothetical protein M1820_003221 [Bogoriella megaspora]|nr:MAG: hypothetical protein M1820_003221 [Bogoriella megaspora]